jgi:hypothetical protein
MARTVEEIADSAPEEAGAVEVRMDSNKAGGHRPPKPLSRKREDKMRNFIFSIFFLSILVVTLSTNADSPLAPPAKVTEASPNGLFTVISYPESSITKIQNTKTKKVLWQIPGWHRWLFVANDGKHAVTGYGGMNLIPQDYDRHMVLISFWREGKKSEM